MHSTLRRNVTAPCLLLAFMCSLCVTACRSRAEWTAYRANIQRSGDQPERSALSNPARVATLHKAWQWQPAGSAGFRASPVLHDRKLYIGNGNGRFYALDAANGAVLWQYPPAASPALTSAFTCNPSSEGLASSAIIAKVHGKDAVIFGAPDRSIGAGLGSGRLFALDANTGAEIWKSPEIARITGLTPGSTTELHEQIGYSSPLVFDRRVYVGIADHCDNPIQNGRVAAVDLETGNLDLGFQFQATSTRGGGIWNSVAAFDHEGDRALFATTGNVRCWNGGCQPEPPVDNGLALLRLNPSNGSVVWKFQPVPFILDGDPDWAAGSTLMHTTCGELVASVMKDGWSYAVHTGSHSSSVPTLRWQFPPTHVPFTPGDGTVHGDTDYNKPGAAWGDVFIVTTGGLNVTSPIGLVNSFSRLHALNACASDADRIRWIKDIPGVFGPGSLGPPTVTHGIVYVGTAAGHVVAIADPSVAPAAGARCAQPDIPTANCVVSGYHLVPDPAILADVALSGEIHTEPVLLDGRVYVSTDAGFVYMLEP
jgi:outer membrane protein assembly factor BamB